MRLTIPLQHAKYFWWGKGWGPKPRTNTDAFYYKMQWNAKSRRPLEVIEQTLPEGVTPNDPNVYMKDELNNELGNQIGNFTLPWPYSNRPIKGTVNDPLYNTQAAFVYQRNKRLIEPINLPLYFSNSILENGLPDRIQKLRDNYQIDDKFVEFSNRRINWCLHSDSALRKLPLDRQFPYLDQRPPRVWGVTVNKKENNLLQSLYDISNMWISKKYGFNPDVVLQRFSNPHCVLPLNRDNKLVLLDLECDFVTLLSPLKSGAQLDVSQFDQNFNISASNKTLNSIHPLSWKMAFDDKNFYNTDFDFQVPLNSSIQTIFLSNNHIRKLRDEDYQGRSIMFCFGFAAQQAKLKYKTDDIDQIVLEKPITIQCVYTNPTDFKVGFVLFQLNTLKWNDETVRNQVWFNEPKSVLTDTKQVIRDLVCIQSFGVHN